MWRFFAAATAIVAAFVFFATQHKTSPPDLKISAPATGTPTITHPEAAGTAAPAGALRGDAAWALSALPDCARQHSEDRGKPERIAAMIPHGAVPVEGHVSAGPCSLEVSRDGIRIVRGSDRLRIPPPARLLQYGDRYYLYTQDRNAATLRVYSLAK